MLYIKSIWLLLALTVVLCTPSFAAQRDRVSQMSVVFYFDKPYEVGQYVNDDWWVVGPVTIDSITPHYYIDSVHANKYDPPRHMHGWEVDPVVGELQGFDSKCRSFGAAKVSALPVTVSGKARSVVKVVSLHCTGTCKPALDEAVVLTVVNAPVPAGTFRPPYIQGDKLTKHISNVRWDLLPSVFSMSVLGSAPGTAALEKQRRLKFDHIPGYQQSSRPLKNMEGYLPYAAKEFGDIILYTMSNAAQADRQAAAIGLLQQGIDWIELLRQGYYWPEGGGEMSGGVLVPAYAAALFNCDTMRQVIRNVAAVSTCFPYENSRLYRNKDGLVLFGHDKFGYTGALAEQNYWEKIRTGSGNGTLVDPYQLIDGGPTPGGLYQGCCTSPTWKSMVLCFEFFPAMKQAWYNEDLTTYVDRWMQRGAHAQPDTCAPFTTDGVYNVDYGPNGHGGCIRDRDPSDGIGRFPARHGVNEGGATAYANNIWAAYWTHTGIAPPAVRKHAPLPQTSGPKIYYTVTGRKTGVIKSLPAGIYLVRHGIDGPLRKVMMLK